MKRISVFILLLLTISSVSSVARVTEPPKYCIISTSCGTRHSVPSEMTNEELAREMDAYEALDCGER